MDVESAELLYEVADAEEQVSPVRAVVTPDVIELALHVAVVVRMAVDTASLLQMELNSTMK